MSLLTLLGSQIAECDGEVRLTYARGRNTTLSARSMKAKLASMVCFAGSSGEVEVVLIESLDRGEARDPCKQSRAHSLGATRACGLVFGLLSEYRRKLLNKRH